MTKEQAIEVLNTYYRGEDNDDREFCSAIDMAIKALEQQPCDDLVNGEDKKLDDSPFVEIGMCKDCKHWKDSDGVYRRGIGAESKCPVNNSRVFEGTFCCADFIKRGNENEVD